MCFVSINFVYFTILGLCDFQYLPLIAKDAASNETRDSKLEYIYDKIVPEKLPDSKWLLYVLFQKKIFRNMLKYSDSRGKS